MKPATELSYKALEVEREYHIQRLVEINEELQRRICQRIINQNVVTEERKQRAMSHSHFEKFVAFMIAMVVGLTVGVAAAQTSPPVSFGLTVGVPTTAGVPVTVSWGASPTAGATYAVVGGYNLDNTFPVNVALPATARSYSQVVPYHSSGTPQPIWRCVYATVAGANSENSCGSVIIATQPVVAGEPSTVMYKEPTTNADATPLLDLAKTTVYTQVDTGPIGKIEVAAASPTGGQDKSVTFPAPAVTGILSAWVTATDAGGNESVVSPKVSKTLGAPGKGSISITTITQ